MSGFSSGLPKGLGGGGAVGGGTPSTSNSSDANLGAGGTFVGTYENINAYASININIDTDQDGVLRLLFSKDGVTANKVSTYDLTEETAVNHCLSLEIRPRWAYFKVEYDNGPTPTTEFDLLVIYRTEGQETDSTPLTILPDKNSYAPLVRSVEAGSTPSEGFVNIPVSGYVIDEVLPLAANELYVSDWLDCRRYNSLRIEVVSDQPSTTGGLSVAFSFDALSGVPDEDFLTDFTYSTPNSGSAKIIPIVGDSVRIYYQNVGFIQSYFQLKIHLLNDTTPIYAQRILEELDEDAVAQVVKSVPSPRTVDGGYDIETMSSVSTGNSSRDLLGSGVVFTGDWQEAKNLGTVFVRSKIVANVASETFQDFMLEMSQDGISVDESIDVQTTLLGDGLTTLTLWSHDLELEYFRIVYTNPVNGAGSSYVSTFVSQGKAPRLKIAQDPLLPNEAVLAVDAIARFYDADTEEFNAAQESDPLPMKDDYYGGEVLAEQGGNDGVLTFTFGSQMRMVVVEAYDTSGTPGDICRVDPFGATPTSTQGMPARDQCPIYIPVVTSEVKIYAPSTMRVNVWGFNR